jgi:hypothetical protein
MSRFDKGVTSYTVCNLDMNIYFPEDEIKCKWCPFVSHYDSLDRDRCQLTSEILYTKEFTGRNCPLTIMNTITEDEK